MFVVCTAKMPSRPAFSTVKPLRTVPAALAPEMTTPLGGELCPAASIVASCPIRVSVFVTLTDSAYVPEATEIVSPAVACWRDIPRRSSRSRRSCHHQRYQRRAHKSQMEPHHLLSSLSLSLSLSL